VAENFLPSAPRDDDASAAALRAFRDEQRERASTDFNEEYQEVFARVIKTPSDMETRARDMQRVVGAFVKHAQVRC
jgi:hypothetical protein